MKKVSIVFGTRPEAIKLVPVILTLRDHRELQPHICVTGQHRALLDQVLSLFAIGPDVDLDLMLENQSVPGFLTRAVQTLDAYFGEHKPEIALVQGDTSTTLATSLAAFYHKIPVGHVEAGLRTGHKYSPFPEEINRVLTTHLADYHFATTDAAEENLIKEGVKRNRIHVTGNTVIDALFLILQKIETPDIKEEIINTLTFKIPGFRSLHSGGHARIVLVTGHRRESFGKPLEEICMALKRLGERRDVHIVYPVHLNPNVQEPVRRILGSHPRIHLIEPLDYLAFVYLMSQCYFIITDSGGIQEEAPSLGKPVLVMRETSERPEGIEAGVAKLVGTKEEAILNAATQLLDNTAAYKAMASARNPYGDGRAAERIVRILASELRTGLGTGKNLD